MKGGKIARVPKVKTIAEADKQRILRGKTVKDLSKGSSLANRFMDTVNMASKNLIKAEKVVDIMPIIRAHHIKKKDRRPLASEWRKKDSYIAPLDRKTYTQRLQFRQNNQDCADVLEPILRQSKSSH